MTAEKPRRHHYVPQFYLRPGVLQEQGQFYDFADIDQAVADCESAKTVKPILRLE